jgi:hypothetical protein
MRGEQPEGQTNRNLPAQNGGSGNMRKFSRGDCVIFDEVPQTASIESRSGGELDSATGEESAYIVQHYMTVRESSQKGTVVLQTKSGKMHVTLNTNPNLRRARWWERVLYRDRFPQLKLG